MAISWVHPVVFALLDGPCPVGASPRFDLTNDSFINGVTEIFDRTANRLKFLINRFDSDRRSPILEILAPGGSIDKPVSTYTTTLYAAQQKERLTHGKQHDSSY